MNSREQAHDEDRRALRTVLFLPILFALVTAALVVGSTALVYTIANNHATRQVRHANDQVRALTIQAQAAANAAQIAANKAQQQALAGCQAYQLIAESPLAPTTTPAGLRLSAAMRIAYSTADCALGPLTPPDPRVAALLPPGVK